MTERKSQFKLTTENIFISGTLRRCLRWDLVLEAEKKSSSSYVKNIIQVSNTAMIRRQDINGTWRAKNFGAKRALGQKTTQPT